MATVYAVASAKGGVGKTTTTAALATILADAGADVVAIDADLGMANLAGAAGVTPGDATLHDVLAGEAEPAATVREGPFGLRVVPGATDLDAYAAADPSELRRVIESFGEADYVFVDAGAGLSHDSTLPLAVADEALLVSTPERTALGDTEKTRQLTERLGGVVAGAAITRVGGAAGAAGDEAVSPVLDAPVLGRIPEDEAVSRAANADRPLLEVAPDAAATRAYRDLARALTDAAVDGPGLDEPAPTAAAGGDDAERDADTDAGDVDGADTVEDAADTGGEAGDDKDIIVADPDPTGVADPGGGDDIIVADEEADESDGTVGADESDGAVGADESDGAVEADESDGTVGADDGPESGAIPDADEAARAATGEAASPEGGSESEPDASDDVDDELAGSIPFRDDDETMTTVLSEAERGGDEDGSSGGDDGESAPDTEPDDAESARDTPPSDEGDDERDGGFFSRLLGR